jgi:hypothetical protein
VGLVVTLAGCSADDGGSPGDSTTKTVKGKPAGSSGAPATSEQNDTSPGPDSEAVDCVPAGTKGNAIGVGKYCQASADCAKGTFCTAGQAPKGAEFCTSFCATDADCGDGATCYQDPRGKACVPNACTALLTK